MGRRVSFWATKRVPRRVRVSFRARGRRVGFWATKRVPKRVRVSFKAKR